MTSRVASASGSRDHAAADVIHAVRSIRTHICLISSSSLLQPRLRHHNRASIGTGLGLWGLPFWLIIVVSAPRHSSFLHRTSYASELELLDNGLSSWRGASRSASSLHFGFLSKLIRIIESDILSSIHPSSSHIAQSYSHSHFHFHLILHISYSTHLAGATSTQLYPIILSFLFPSWPPPDSYFAFRHTRSYTPDPRYRYRYLYLPSRFLLSAIPAHAHDTRPHDTTPRAHTRTFLAFSHFAFALTFDSSFTAHGASTHFFPVSLTHSPPHSPHYSFLTKHCLGHFRLPFQSPIRSHAMHAFGFRFSSSFGFRLAFGFSHRHHAHHPTTHPASLFIMYFLFSSRTSGGGLTSPHFQFMYSLPTSYAHTCCIYIAYLFS